MIPPGSEAGLGFARYAEDLHLRGDTGEALRVLTAGLRRESPGGIIARLVLARICREDGKPVEAREWLESALRADPECPAALLQLSELRGGTHGALHDPCLTRLAAQEPWDEGFRTPVHSLISKPRADREAAPPILSSTFAFPVREEEEEAEMDVESPPHIATVTLAEIYFQQGLKEQAAQIYRQLLERQPGDVTVEQRLREIELSSTEPGTRAADGSN